MYSGRGSVIRIQIGCKSGPGFRSTLYYEDEINRDPSVEPDQEAQMYPDLAWVPYGSIPISHKYMDPNPA